jgi:diadenylate cyclase
VARRRSEALLGALAAVAPGKPLREGLDRILQAGMGALIVVSDGPEVLNICSGGFLLDAAFSPQRLSELAKMDGAIILAGDASRIARANVHLVPNPNVPTSETGTRHRTAERVARSINVPVISVSEDMSIIAVYNGDQKHQLVPIPRLLDRANQALQTLERYKNRLDEVSQNLAALEVEDLVTIRDVVVLLQRTEMVTRIADEIEDAIVELGTDGRLVRLQLEEVMAGVEDERRMVVLDYFHEETEWHLEEAMAGLSELDTDELLDLKLVAEVLHLPEGVSDLDGCRNRSSNTSWSDSATCRRSCARPSTTWMTSRVSARREPRPSRKASRAWPNQAFSIVTTEQPAGCASPFPPAPKLS